MSHRDLNKFGGVRISMIMNCNQWGNRLFKIQPLLDFFLERFQTVYKPTQQLSLDKAVIHWRGRLRIWTYNPAKLTKCGLLVRLVTESTSGYIGNLEIYSGPLLGSSSSVSLFSGS
jgi:hypothetical protein